jgi:hypothetical protein
MEKRFLLDRIELERADVAPGDAQTPSFVEPDTADAVLSFSDDTSVAAGEAFDLSLPEVPAQDTARSVLLQNLPERYFLRVHTLNIRQLSGTFNVTPLINSL